ncbi:protein extra-macrochaetae [Condylostylus longicornis]|uniref:protein extra-macrochaetae n=1 Tax=Condylostylus longicornis TaxID=2530218 RepID=UPI00244E0323|nr:protein extra-macrochaetae [Condylostylus longicornis]
MKTITAITTGGSGVTNGRISRRQSDHGSGENAEIKMYLSKLKDLVPFMPKNRKLSKLEIIQNVIDYICDLQNELETHPTMSAFDASTALSDDSNDNHHYNNININERNNNNNINNHYNNNNSNSNIYNTSNNTYNINSSTSHNHHLHQNSQYQYLVRRPLVDRSSPNTILSDSEIHQQNLINNQQLIHSHTMADKSA